MNINKCNKLFSDPNIKFEMNVELGPNELNFKTVADQKSDTAALAIYEEIVVQLPSNRTARRAFMKVFEYKASAFFAVTWLRNFA